MPNTNNDALVEDFLKEVLDMAVDFSEARKNTTLEYRVELRKHFKDNVKAHLADLLRSHLQ